MCKGDGKSEREWAERVREEHIDVTPRSEDGDWIDRLHAKRRNGCQKQPMRVSTKSIKPMLHIDIGADEPIVEIPGTPGLPSLRVASHVLPDVARDPTEAIDELIDSGISPSRVFALAKLT